MKKLRKHVAVAIDGGGIKGVMVAKALAMLEEYLDRPCREIFRLAAGTSTGSIISAGISAGMTAESIHTLYVTLGKSAFRKGLRYHLWPLARYKYANAPLMEILQNQLGDRTLGDLWQGKPRRDLVITVRDLVENRTRFLKPWKPECKDWELWRAVLASCAVPAYFPVVDGRYVDGGTGSYSNPCYLAAFEAAVCLRWKLSETTLLSFGTGRSPNAIRPGQADSFFPWQWLYPLFDTFLADASDQQVRLVRHFFKGLDFRRYQIDIDPIDLDDVSQIDTLTEYGRRLGERMLNDEEDAGAVRPAGRA